MLSDLLDCVCLSILDSDCGCILCLELLLIALLLDLEVLPYIQLRRYRQVYVYLDNRIEISELIIRFIFFIGCVKDQCN